MAINFEALTVLGGEFLEFSELPEDAHIVIKVSEENFLGGIHLEAQGDGESFWANYDSDEFYLRFERILCMEVGETFSVSHNNWYGQEDEFKILAKDSTELYGVWTRSFNTTYGECGDNWEEKVFFLINYSKGLVEKAKALFYFRLMQNEFEDFVSNLLIEAENFEGYYEFPPCESTYCLGCGDKNCPYRHVEKEKKEIKFTTCSNCYNCGKCESLSYVDIEDY